VLTIIADPVPEQGRPVPAKGPDLGHQELLPGPPARRRRRAAPPLTRRQDYDGKPGDSDAGRDYFKKRFARLAQKAGRSKEREVYIHTTTATDTTMLRKVMAAVEECVSRPPARPFAPPFLSSSHRFAPAFFACMSSARLMRPKHHHALAPRRGRAHIAPAPPAPRARARAGRAAFPTPLLPRLLLFLSPVHTASSLPLALSVSFRILIASSRSSPALPRVVATTEKPWHNRVRHIKSRSMPRHQTLFCLQLNHLEEREPISPVLSSHAEP
jgi:hypothetical protein